MNIPQKVRESSKFILSKAQHLSVDWKKVDELQKWIKENPQYDEIENSSSHPIASEWKLNQILRFYFIIDTLNFCFWHNDMEYEDLVKFIKDIMISDPEYFNFQNFSQLNFPLFLIKFGELFADKHEQLPARFDLLRETISAIHYKFNDDLINWIDKCDYDCLKMLEEIISFIHGFQDACVYKGRQVFFYKRAQILIGDIYAAVNAYGKLGDFKNNQETQFFKKINNNQLQNSHLLTCFADYRVPQVLSLFGVYKQPSNSSFEKELDLVDKTVYPGSELECEIRASMIIVVEYLAKNLGLTDIEIDWILWQYGEKRKDSLGKPFKCLTVFY